MNRTERDSQRVEPLPEGQRRRVLANARRISHARHGQTKLGYLWPAPGPAATPSFAWHTSRAAACLENIIRADFRGTVQSDGYAAYPAFVRQQQHQRRKRSNHLAACWAHASRGLHRRPRNHPANLRLAPPPMRGATAPSHTNPERILHGRRSYKSAPLPNRTQTTRKQSRPAFAQRRARRTKHHNLAPNPRRHPMHPPAPTSRKAQWAKPSPTPSNNGPPSNTSSPTAKSRLTTTESKTPSAPPR